MTFIQGQPRNAVSTLNSTATLLNAGIAFTGTAEDVSAFDSVVVAVKTDQNGTWSVQFSNDGVNWDSVLSRYYRTAQIEPPHRFTITRKYCRVVFTNTSAANQTFLRLQTTFGQKGDLNSPVDSVLSQDFDATAVRPTDFNFEVGLGRRQGATAWNKFGYNGDVDIGTEVIAAFGGSFTPLLAASTLRFVSTSTADNGATATGALTLTLSGVDANRVAATETITLNGTTNVDTVTTWLGINRVAIATAGSGLTNAGLITVTAITGGTTQATIPIGSSTTQQCIFFTQTDHQSLATFLVLNADRIGSGTEPDVTFIGRFYSAVSNAITEVFRFVLSAGVENHLTVAPPQPFVLSEKGCFWIEATTTQNNTVASARFSLIEMRDVDA